MVRNNKFILKIVLIVLILLLVCIFGTLTFFHIVNMNYINDVVFSLNGSPLVEIEVGNDWIDPSVLALYNDDSIIDSVLINNNVNTNVPGNYKITYTITKGWIKKTLVRTVIVKEKNDDFYIELKGNEISYIMKGSSYKEVGYDAYYNGVKVSDEVKVVGNVDTSNVGEYILKYQIVKDNHFREKIRKVVVIDFNFQLSLKDDNEYVKENSIVFSTLDDNYDYVLLPDGKTDSSRNITYKIVSNGTYSFTVYNKLGFFVKKVFKIDNIDNKVPTGSCVGYMYDTYTKLVVDANDQSGISSYEYHYGSHNSGKIDSGVYQYKEFINEASVIIYDKVNNKNSVNCNMVDKSSVYSSSYNSYIFDDPDSSRDMKYWLYIPKNVTKRKPVPLLVYLHGDGGRGNNINLVNGWSYPSFVKNGQEFPFMMVAGQIGNDTNWTDSSTYKRLMRLVDYIIANYSVNTKKIILAGGSSGGGGVYVITANYPKYFSCSVVGSGIYDSSYRTIANQLVHTPMWIFHGTNDTHIYYDSVKSFANYINSLGGQVNFVGIDGEGHDVTETVDGFKNPKLIEWMLKQERN